MNIFLDTEFTDFKAPKLISIGLAANNMATFYAEVECINELTCSDFVREVVLPQLGKRPERVFDSLQLYTELTEWLKQFEQARPTICYDYEGDWSLMVSALHMNVPDWLLHRNISHMIHGLSQEQFYLDTGLPDHHALYDAQANQFAYNRLYGRR